MAASTGESSTGLAAAAREHDLIGGTAEQRRYLAADGVALG